MAKPYSAPVACSLCHVQWAFPHFMTISVAFCHQQALKLLHNLAVSHRMQQAVHYLSKSVTAVLSISPGLLAISLLQLAVRFCGDAGKNLQAQYERWQPKAKYKQHMDPTVEDVKKLSISSRRLAKVLAVPFLLRLSISTACQKASGRYSCSACLI